MTPARRITYGPPARSAITPPTSLSADILAILRAEVA
jgi:hypothetical protein